jgi:hypothetical protein
MLSKKYDEFQGDHVLDALYVQYMSVSELSLNLNLSSPPCSAIQRAAAIQLSCLGFSNEIAFVMKVSDGDAVLMMPDSWPDAIQEA